MNEIDAIEDLYDTVGKDNLFKSLNRCMENGIYFGEDLESDLLDKKISNDISSFEKINAQDIIAYEADNIEAIKSKLSKKYNIEIADDVFYELIGNYISSEEINDVIDYVNELLNDRYKQLKYKKVETAEEMVNVDDSIGESTECYENIDLGSRDGNFIIINGEVITGNNNATHSELINEYIDEYLHEDIDEEVGDCKVRNLNLFEQLSNDTPIAFGHIVSNMAFIETCENYAVEDAVAILKEKCSFKKIYDYDADESIITRLAKRR